MVKTKTKLKLTNNWKTKTKTKNKSKRKSHCAGPIATKCLVQMPCGRGSSDGSAQRYVLPVLLMTSCHRSGLYGDSGVVIPRRSLMSVNASLLLLLLFVIYDYY